LSSCYQCLFPATIIITFFALLILSLHCHHHHLCAAAAVIVIFALQPLSTLMKNNGLLVWFGVRGEKRPKSMDSNGPKKESFEKFALVAGEKCLKKHPIWNRPIQSSHG
jgi:hypothetical protein